MSMHTEEEMAHGEGLRLRLEQVDPGLAQLQQLAFSGRGSVRFSFAGAPFALTLTNEEAAFTPALSMLLQAGQAKGWLLLESYAPAGDEWAGVLERLDPVLVRALLIEEASQQIARLAAACGSAVQLVDLQAGQTFVTKVPTQAMRLVNEQTGIGVRAALRSDDPQFFACMATALEKCAPVAGNAPAAACVPLCISLGVAWMEREEIKQSRGGDVLVFPADGQLEAVHAVCFDRKGRRLPLKVLLSGHSGRLSYSQEEVMVNEQNEMRPITSSTLPLEELSVPVTAVIGELELPLNAVGNLQAGYVFELPVSVDQAIVQLYTGSRRVGAGRLVAIGDRLGVRLLEWGADSHVNAA